MKFFSSISVLAAIVTIAAYFGVKPEYLEAKPPEMNIENGNANYQIYNTGSINIAENKGQSSSTLECSKENLYVAKFGYYGAINPDIYSKMNAALKNNDKKTLEFLLRDHSVIEIPSGSSVCLKEIAWNWYRKKILLPGSQITYWVSDNAIEKVN